MTIARTHVHRAALYDALAQYVDNEADHCEAEDIPEHAKLVAAREMLDAIVCAMVERAEASEVE